MTADGEDHRPELEVLVKPIDADQDAGMDVTALQKLEVIPSTAVGDRVCRPMPILQSLWVVVLSTAADRDAIRATSGSIQQGLAGPRVPANRWPCTRV